MMYSQEALEEMANKIDLLEYASHTVDFVKRSGNTYFAVCPFHDEKTASLAVNTEYNFWKCFGCEKKGNIYTWIQLTEHLTFDQAVQKVANLTNSDINDYVESESLSFFKLLNRINTNRESKNSSERDILDIEKDYNQKFTDSVPQEWLDEGINPEEMRKYEIRIDTHSNRIVYPVYDAEFRLIGVKGRTRFKNYKDLHIMKYMNYFKLHRLDFFIGMKQALPFIKQKNEIIITEGIKSVMKLDEWGFHNTVSAETSTLNEYQIELLIKMKIKDIIIAFDKDVQLTKIKGCVQNLKKFSNVWAIIDRHNRLDEKDSPPDKGKEIFDKLYEEKIRL